MSAPGKLHLIPVGLGDADIDDWLPSTVQHTARSLKTYIAENAKTARAFLKQAGTEHVMADIAIHSLGRNTTREDIRNWLQPLATGEHIGLVSEAGCPAIADPGAQVVELAHQLGFEVMPHVGPSSLLLGLMASGLNGQQFAFHGYAPKSPQARAQQLKNWEATSRRHRQTQILIETPYRNDALFDTLVRDLHGQTRLCVARALTTPEQWIRSLPVHAWRQTAKPNLTRMPTLFLFLAD